MNEIFRFMTIRSAQLADPNSAIDLTTFIATSGAEPAPSAQTSPSGRKQLTPSGRAKAGSAIASLFAAPKAPSALRFVPLYDSLISEIRAASFDATTTNSVVLKAIGKTALATWVKSNKDYLADKNDAAVALIAAHLRPPADGRIDTLATYVRLMNLIDALADAKVIAATATLDSYFHMIIIAPSGIFPLLQVGPPYNPFVVPAGFADLQVVNQELLGYEKKEISYIANVLQSESSKRVTVRFEKTDQTYTSTTDTTTQTEQDTQSTERFQVQTQAQSTIQEDSNLKFGLSISASYGPSVNVKSNLDYGNSQATTNSQSVSTSYGKDITTRSVSKVTQEVTQQQRLDVVNSFKERIEHGLDNTSGTTNISGVYQYVDALYEVGVFNYGQRLLLDLIVPDPAALIRDAISAANGSAVTAYNPPPISFGPSELTLPSNLVSPISVSYDPKATYIQGVFVSYSGALYLSLQNANKGNEPDANSAWWSKAAPWNLYDPSATYANNAVVNYNGTLYLSLQNANMGKEPDANPTSWKSITPGNLYPDAAQYYSIQNLQIPNGRTPNPTDYTQAAQIYQVTGLKAPLDPVVTIAKSYQAQSSTTTGAGNITPIQDTVQIPPGYLAVSAMAIAGLQSMTQNSPGYNLSVTIGDQFIQWGLGLWATNVPQGAAGPPGSVASGASCTVPLRNERNLLGITIAAGVVLQFEVTIEVTCVLTNEAFAQWQLDTYSSIYQAYLNLQSSYQQATGNSQQALAGSNYPGSSPDENRRVIQVELKREIISMVTLNQYDPPTVAAAYAPATTYAAGAVVSYTNGIAYVSLQNGNTGHEPDTNPAWWSTKVSQFNAPKIVSGSYDPSATYAIGTVVGFNGIAYISLQAGNTGHEPDTSPIWWGADTATYVDVNLPSWSGQGGPSTQSDINFPVLFAQAPLIHFMEEAFEWEQMQYIFYPYYWNSKSKWFKLALLEDPDSLFTQFLRAGAARVVVPIRPGFEEVFLYYLQTGQPWDGGSAPQVYDPLYLSIATEIEDANQIPVTETLLPPTWTMRLPTTLTMLRANPPTIAPYAPGATYPIGSVVSFAGVTYISSQVPYEPTTTYTSGSVVNYIDTSYASIQNANTGNEPDTNPTWWVPTSNKGNEPDASPAWWSPHDASLPSWTLDSYLNVTASN